VKIIYIYLTIGPKKWEYYTKIENTRNGISINLNSKKSIFNKSFRIVLKLNKSESNKIEKIIKENL